MVSLLAVTVTVAGTVVVWEGMDGVGGLRDGDNAA
jgi:hypothetical protein